MTLTRLKIGEFLGVRALLVWYRHLGLKKSDVFIASYPRSGNTWLRFMLASIITGRECNFDNLADVIPEVERHRNKKYVSPNGIRLIKTHEKWRSEYRKTVYIIRDGRDVAVSYYFHQRRLGLFKGSFSQFLRLFLMGKVGGYGSWRENVESWLQQNNRDPRSVLIIKYEDMLNKTFDVVRRIALFLNIEASEQRIKWAIEQNSAANMRKKEQSSVFLKQQNKTSNITFVRKASSGYWKQYFTDDDTKLFTERFGKALARLGYW